MLKHRTSPILWIMGIPLRVFIVLLIFTALCADTDDVYAEVISGTDSYEGTSFEYRVSLSSYGNKTVISKITSVTAEDGIARIPSTTNGYAVDTVGLNNTAVMEEPLRSQIKGIELAEGIKSIGRLAFHGCTGLERLELPDSLTMIDDQAFLNCSSLSELDLNKVESIHTNTFYGCTALTSVHVPASVTRIDSNAFSGCSSLKTYTVDGASSGFSAFDGVLYDKNMTTLLNYPIGKEGSSFTVPDVVKTIGVHAFKDSRLESVDLPEGLERIEANAFHNCDSLTSINMKQGLRTIGNNAFQNCDVLESINIPEGVTYIADGAFSQCRKLLLVDLPDSLTTLGTGVFSHTNIDQRFTIPSGLKTIPDRTFDNCSNMHHFVIPETIENIGESAFYNNRNLKDIYFAGSTTTIGQNAFFDCGQSYPGGFIIVAPPGSAAASYAVTVNITTVSITYEQYVLVMNGEELIDPDDGQGGDSGSDPGDEPGDGQGGGSDDPDDSQGEGQGGESGSGSGSGQGGSGTPVSPTYTHAVTKTVITLTKPVLKTKNKKGRKIKLTWSRVEGADGYMIYVKGPKDKKFRLRLRKSAKVKSITHKGLIRGKKYKYKIVAFRVADGMTYTSPASKVKTVKVKK